MWASERGTARDLALLRVPLSSFSDGQRQRAARQPTACSPTPAGQRPEPLRRRLPALRRGAAGDGLAAAVSLYAVRCTDDFAHEVPLAARRRPHRGDGRRRGGGRHRRRRPALHQRAPRRAPRRRRPLHAHRRGAGRDAQPRLLLQGRQPRTRACSACRSSAPAAARAPPAAARVGLDPLPAQPGAVAERARHARLARDGAATTAAAPPASTGTATRGRSSSGTASSR